MLEYRHIGKRVCLGQIPIASACMLCVLLHVTSSNHRCIVHSWACMHGLRAMGQHAAHAQAAQRATKLTLSRAL